MKEALTSEKETRDRPAQNPGGVECQRCGCTFIGEEWHQFCGACVRAVASELRTAQLGVEI